MINYLIYYNYNYKYYLLICILLTQINVINGKNVVSLLLKKDYINENMLKLMCLSLSYSLQPQIKKLSSNSLNINVLDSLALNHIIQTLIILFIFLYNNKRDIIIYKLNIKNTIYTIMSCILTFFQSYQFNKLIKQNNVSSLLPLMNCYINLFSVIIGYLFFNENINNKTIIGIIFISIGSNLIK